MNHVFLPKEPTEKLPAWKILENVQLFCVHSNAFIKIIEASSQKWRRSEERLQGLWLKNVSKKQGNNSNCIKVHSSLQFFLFLFHFLFIYFCSYGMSRPSPKTQTEDVFYHSTYIHVVFDIFFRVLFMIRFSFFYFFCGKTMLLDAIKLTKLLK